MRQYIRSRTESSQNDAASLGIQSNQYLQFRESEKGCNPVWSTKLFTLLTTFNVTGETVMKTIEQNTQTEMPLAPPLAPLQSLDSWWLFISVTCVLWYDWRSLSFFGLLKAGSWELFKMTFLMRQVSLTLIFN